MNINPLQPLSEQAIQVLEAKIPRLAQLAYAQARLKALTLGGKVMEVVNGHLVETNADGSVRVIRKTAPSFAVGVGSKRLRKINRKEISV